MEHEYARSQQVVVFSAPWVTSTRPCGYLRHDHNANVGEKTLALQGAFQRERDSR